LARMTLGPSVAGRHLVSGSGVPLALREAGGTHGAALAAPRAANSMILPSAVRLRRASMPDLRATLPLQLPQEVRVSAYVSLGSARTLAQSPRPVALPSTPPPLPSTPPPLRMPGLLGPPRFEFKFYGPGEAPEDRCSPPAIPASTGIRPVPDETSGSCGAWAPSSRRHSLGDPSAVPAATLDAAPVLAGAAATDAAAAVAAEAAQEVGAPLLWQPPQLRPQPQAQPKAQLQVLLPEQQKQPQPQSQAARFQAMAAQHERQVAMAEATRATADMERQLNELLETQRALRQELEQVKAQVSSNSCALEAVKEVQAQVIRERAAFLARSPPTHPRKLGMVYANEWTA